MKPIKIHRGRHFRRRNILTSLHRRLFEGVDNLAARIAGRHSKFVIRLRSGGNRNSL